MKVMKKDGSKEEFDRSKIETACRKAAITARMRENDINNVAKDVAEEVEEKLKGKEKVSTRKIRKEVISSLRNRNVKIARSFTRSKK